MMGGACFLVPMQSGICVDSAQFVVSVHGQSYAAPFSMVASGAKLESRVLQCTEDGVRVLWKWMPSGRAAARHVRVN